MEESDNDYNDAKDADEERARFWEAMKQKPMYERDAYLSATVKWIGSELFIEYLSAQERIFGVSDLVAMGVEFMQRSKGLRPR